MCVHLVGVLNRVTLRNALCNDKDKKMSRHLHLCILLKITQDQHAVRVVSLGS